jgi:hypothetical protein
MSSQELVEMAAAIRATIAEYLELRGDAACRTMIAGRLKEGSRAKWDYDVDLYPAIVKQGVADGTAEREGVLLRLLVSGGNASPLPNGRVFDEETSDDARRGHFAGVIETLAILADVLPEGVVDCLIERAAVIWGRGKKPLTREEIIAAAKRLGLNVSE